MIPPIVRRMLGMRTPDAFARADDRDWRKLISQEVHRVPAGATGRRRAARSWFSAAFITLLLAGMACLTWFALDDAPAGPRASALRVRTDGWLPEDAVRTLAFPSGFSAARDVAAIRQSLEADSQVLGARVRRLADGTLEVELRERLAVARLEPVAAPGAVPSVRLLGADGVPFAGVGYPSQAVRNLPLVTDLPAESSGGERRSAGLELAAAFLAAARAGHGQLHAEWQAVSLRDCLDGRTDIPGATLRVIVRPASQPADRPALEEIVFSNAEWNRELAVLAGLRLDELLRRPGMTARGYVLKLHVRNRSQPGTVTMEPRLVPAASR
ncbi:MAG: hypothetical protein ACK5VI_10615 [Opitutia bacterium]